MDSQKKTKKTLELQSFFSKRISCIFKLFGVRYSKNSMAPRVGKRKSGERTLFAWLTKMHFGGNRWLENHIGLYFLGDATDLMGFYKRNTKNWRGYSPSVGLGLLLFSYKATLWRNDVWYLEELGESLTSIYLSIIIIDGRESKESVWPCFSKIDSLKANREF